MQSEFEHLWREFARSDANVTAPVRLRDAVMSAWDTAHGEPVSSTRRPRAVRVALAAGLVAVTVLTAVTLREPETTVRESIPLIRLVADPVFQNEPLTLVRLRAAANEPRGDRDRVYRTREGQPGRRGRGGGERRSAAIDSTDSTGH